MGHYPASRRASPRPIDRDIYQLYHRIENFFGKLKEFKRSGKTDQSFSAMIHTCRSRDPRQMILNRPFFVEEAPIVLKTGVIGDADMAMVLTDGRTGAPIASSSLFVS